MCYIKLMQQKIFLYGGIGFLILVIIVVIVSLSGNKKPKTTDTKQAEKITLNWWHPLDDPLVLKPIIAEFEKENPHIKINLIQPSLNNYELEATNALSAGTGPDIWSLPNSWMPRHLDKLIYAPDDFFKKNKKDTTTNIKYFNNKFVPVVVDENTKEDKVYGIPLFTDTLAIYYNKTLIKAKRKELQKSGVNIDYSIFDQGPRTWNEFNYLVALYTQKSGASISKPAVALGRAENVKNSQDIVALLMLQNGAKIVSADGITATFNLPESTNINEQYYPGTKALEFYCGFSNPSNPYYTWNSQYKDSYTAFRDNELAMIFAYDHDLKNLFQEAPTFSLGVWTMPQIDYAKEAIDMARYWTETVPNVSKHRLEAWKFIYYLHKIGQGDYSAGTRRPSPFKPKVLPESILQRVELSKPQKFQTQTAKTWYRGRDPEEFEKLFKQMIQAGCSKPENSQKYIDTGAVEITKLLRGREGYTPEAAVTPEKEVKL